MRSRYIFKPICNISTINYYPPRAQGFNILSIVYLQRPQRAALAGYVISLPPNNSRNNNNNNSNNNNNKKKKDKDRDKDKDKDNENNKEENIKYKYKYKYKSKTHHYGHVPGRRVHRRRCVAQP